TFQNIRLFPNLTVLENVLIGMHARLSTGAVEALLRLPRTMREEHMARERAMEILAVFGNRLVPRVDHVVSSLSYANRRRDEIAEGTSAEARREDEEIRAYLAGCAAVASASAKTVRGRAWPGHPREADHRAVARGCPAQGRARTSYWLCLTMPAAPLLEF